MQVALTEIIVTIGGITGRVIEEPSNLVTLRRITILPID